MESDANDVGESGEKNMPSCPATSDVCSQSIRTVPVRSRIMPSLTPLLLLGKPPAKSNCTSPRVFAPAISGPKASRPISDWRRVPPKVPADSPAYRDELFGPVASVFRARDASDAVRISNDSRYGLGSAVWTNDVNEAGYFARELQAGTVFVNGMVASDPRFPFGGVKASGYGRELSAFGLREFVNIKTVRGFGLDKSQEQTDFTLSE